MMALEAIGILLSHERATGKAVASASGQDLSPRADD